MDVVDEVGGLSPELRQLRQQRPDFVTLTQGSYDVLVTPRDPAGVSLGERAACALRVAELHQDAALAAHYRARLQQVASDGEESPRLPAMLRHVDLITPTPDRATAADIAALQAAGLSERDIVILTQLVAFVSYQTRVLFGLQLLAGEIPG
jgi:uncharacterized protein YciW